MREGGVELMRVARKWNRNDIKLEKWLQSRCGKGSKNFIGRLEAEDRLQRVTEKYGEEIESECRSLVQFCFSYKINGKAIGKGRTFYQRVHACLKKSG